MGKVSDGQDSDTRPLGAQFEGLGLHVTSWTGIFLFSAWLPRNASLAAGAENVVGSGV